jgi:acyl-CoA synthetase (AMP-forming)/AMP-acid ligase II
MRESMHHRRQMHTGDGTYMDEDGFIFVVDRIKDMIVSGGKNIYCGEVESAIARHPAIATRAVIGISDDKWGSRACGSGEESRRASRARKRFNSIANN